MTGPSAPTRLRTDFRDAPIDIDIPPLLSWEPDGTQDAVELELGPVGGATSVEGRDSPTPRWELVLPKDSMTRYRWRVRTVRAGHWSPWSAWSWFETALLRESDWGGAVWIRSRKPGPSPVLSCRFVGVGRSGLRLAVSGLGVVDVRINGSAVTEAVLDPPPSAYGSVVHYRLWDVSELVTTGTNTLTARLGRGFYAMTTRTAFGWHTAPWRDEPKLRAVLFDRDHPGRPLLVSDETWTATLTPVTDDSFYAGEVIDFSRTPISVAVVPAAAPAGALRVSRQPPVTRREHVEIVGAARTGGGSRQRFELAANVAGMIAVRTDDTSRPTLRVKLGEKLGDAGEVVADDPAVHAELQCSSLVEVPAGVEIPLELSYSGLRYAEVAGTTAPVSITVDRISAAPASVGSFTSSDSLLNTIHRMTRSTLENCLQGTPVDTPLYEKQGYTGDAQLLTETYAYNYWMPNYLGGWYESSVLPSLGEDGSLPGIAPAPPGDWIFDTPSPAWDAALFEVPETLARHYGDVATMRRSLPSLRRYLGFLARRFPDGIVRVGLGDWNAPGHIMPPEQPAIVSTAYHYRFLTVMGSFLTRLGEPAEARRYAARAAAIRARFDDEFWADGWYASPGDEVFRQTDNLLAVSFGLARGERRSAALERLERDLRDRDMHLDTGMVGTRQLLRVLGRRRPRLAFEVVRAPGYPGWSHWIDNGATTLYENWELDGRSHDHAMFGTIDEWLFADVAGLSPGADGWSVVHVAPRLPGDGSFACRASLETISGPLDVEWEDHGRRIRGRVTAPNHLPIVVPGDAGSVERSRRSIARGRLTEHTIELEATTSS